MQASFLSFVEAHAAHSTHAAAAVVVTAMRAFSFGASATIASVVTSRPATEAASCRARAHDLGRVDDALLHHVDILFGLGVEAEGLGLVLEILPTTIEPSTPAFSAIWRIGASMRLQHDVDAGLNVGIVVRELADAPSWRAAAQRRRPARCLLPPPRGLR